MQSQASPKLESALTLWARFASPAMEARFRGHQRALEIRQVNFAMILAIIGTLPFIPMDHRLYGWSTWFWSLVALRSGWMLVCATVMALYRLERFAPYADRLMLAWGVVGGIGILVIGYSRPAAVIMGFLMSVMTPMLLVYFVLPMPLAWQFGLCMMGLAGDLHIVWLRHAALDPLAPRAIVINYVMANIMGVAVAWNMHRLRRRQYAALQREIGLRHGLQEAMSQVKTLQGFLPICMHCKSVRNDEGYWQQVEVYVRENSMAEFTHGICPKCAHEHFGEAMTAKAG